MNISSLNLSISQSVISTHGCTLSIPNFLFSRYSCSHFLHKSTKNHHILSNKKIETVVFSSLALGSQISDWAQEDEEQQQQPHEEEEQNNDVHESEATFSQFEKQSNFDDVDLNFPEKSRVSEVGNSILEGGTRVPEEKSRVPEQRYDNFTIGEEQRCFNDVDLDFPEKSRVSEGGNSILKGGTRVPEQRYENFTIGEEQRNFNDVDLDFPEKSRVSEGGNSVLEGGTKVPEQRYEKSRVSEGGNSILEGGTRVPEQRYEKSRVSEGGNSILEGGTRVPEQRSENFTIGEERSNFNDVDLNFGEKSRVSEEKSRVPEQRYEKFGMGEEKIGRDDIQRRDLGDSSSRDLGLGDGFTFPIESKVYVGNFSYDTDSQRLADLFSRAGTVELTEIVYNRMTGQSRGFGFVTMSSAEEAANAMKMFHLYEFNGRTLIVNKALNRGALAGDERRRLRFGIFVGNLSADSSKEQLIELFSAHGTVVDTQVITDRETGAPRGFGFVNMSTEIAQANAISALDGQVFNGRVLTVNRAAPKGTTVPVYTAFIANISWEVDEAQLQQMFTQHGRVLGLRVICDRETGLSKGYGFVKLASEAELNDAVSALDGKLVAGRMMKVMKAVPRQDMSSEQRADTAGVSPTPYNRRLGGAEATTMHGRDEAYGPPSSFSSTMESEGWDRGFGDQIEAESQDRDLGGMVEPWNNDGDESYESNTEESDFDL